MVEFVIRNIGVEKINIILFGLKNLVDFVSSILKESNILVIIGIINFNFGVFFIFIE